MPSSTTFPSYALQLAQWWDYTTLLIVSFLLPLAMLYIRTTNSISTS